MPAHDLAEPFAALDEASEQSNSSSTTRRAVIGVVAIGSLLGVALLVSTVGGPHVEGQGGELAVTSLATSDACPIETGGSCYVNDCFAWRGDTSCHHGSCNCKNDQCAGWDGKCRSGGQYHKIASGIKLRNAKWPDNYMYVSSSGSMRASNDPGDKGTFTAYQVPGHRDTASKGWRIMLVSEKWPDYAIGTKSSTIESRSIDGTGVPMISLEFQPAPCDDCDPHPMIMTSSEEKNLFFYESKWTSGIHGTSSDPGVAGYWYMEPRIHEVLP